MHSLGGFLNQGVAQDLRIARCHFDSAKLLRLQGILPAAKGLHQQGNQDH